MKTKPMLNEFLENAKTLTSILKEDVVRRNNQLVEK